MEKITLQIQSVIYNNSQDALLKAIQGLDCALDYCKKHGMEISADLIYGDASDKQVVDDVMKQTIKDSFSNLNFAYDYFGFNSGTARGHNRLGEKCETEYMMIMNPDVILEPSCLYEMMRLFTKNDIGMVEARQTPLELSKVYDADTLETEWASTACTVFKTKIFHELNGFDYETFFMYCDDLDFSWRLRLLGYRILYNPQAVVFHAKTLSNTAGWQPSSAEIYYSAEAAILMAYKYSNNERVEKILRQFDEMGGADEKRAANAFRERREKGELPAQIDEEREVAKFLGDYYSKMRFTYS